MQDDLLNQMRNFMQNLYDGPPGEDKKHKATTDTELSSTKYIQPLSVQEPPQNSDIRQLIREECSTEASEQQKQKMEDTMLELEVKNIVEQQAERGNRSIQSLQNFKVVHKKPEHLLSMEYKHLSITPKTEFDEVTESNAENLLPIPSKCEVALEDKKKFYDDDFEDIEYVEASLFDPEIASVEEIVSVEEENVVQQEEEESDNSLLDIFLPEFETFCDHSEETRSGKTTHADNSLPEYDSFCFEIEPDQERLINLMKNDISDLSNNSLLEEVDLFLSDDSIPPGIENIADNPEGDILFLEEMLINDSILSPNRSSDPDFQTFLKDE
nr:hypothetical protein [Tanacetum cinerariifolium]